MSKKIFISHSPEETEKFAAEFSSILKKGDLVALCGPLGGGKTTFVRGLFYGMGGDPARLVTSPTFTILHEHSTKKAPLYHIDLYRLEKLSELDNAGLDDYLEGDGIAVVEWGDKIPELCHRFTHSIRFDIAGDEERKICIKSGGPIFMLEKK